MGKAADVACGASERHISDPRFVPGSFFNPDDSVQIRYEMLRRVENGESTIKDATEMYGYSRQAYYDYRRAFGEGGILALSTKKAGPKGPRKMTDEVKKFFADYLLAHPRATGAELSRELKASTGVEICASTASQYKAALRKGSH